MDVDVGCDLDAFGLYDGLQDSIKLEHDPVNLSGSLSGLVAWGME